MNIRDLVPLIDKVVADNSTLLTKNELGVDYLLHVSRHKIKNNTFIPRIAYSQSKSENRTFLRVNCAKTIIDCINGIANLQYDFVNDFSDKNSNRYYIYAIPFEYVLKPNTKLVFDSDFTDEMWLFTYSDTTKVFKADLIGEFFVSRIETTPIKKEKHVYNTKMITIECDTRSPVYVDDKNLYDGFFKFTFNINVEDHIESIEKTNKSTFEKLKLLSSALEDMKPKWVSW